MTNTNQEKEFDVIVVGAGPAGLGVGVLLEQLGLNYIILEKHSVGASFKKWPKETRFISPSFTGNFFKMPDLNAITPDSSPAFSLLTEHPSGSEYAKYLEDVSEFYEIKVENDVEVKTVQKKDLFSIETNKGEYKSKFLIWAGGEFQYPAEGSFEGANLCLHYAKIPSFSELEGEERIIIGGYESGFDSAVNLVKSGKKVTVIDSSDYMKLVNSDSSYSLSPHTRDRIREAIDNITHLKETRVKKVELADNKYIVTTEDNETITTNHKPINCTGFNSSLSLVKELFDYDDGYPLLNDFDESAKTSGLYLVGPQVKHGDALFCFIYKYRQRFAIVAETLANKLNISPNKIEDILQEYKDNNFYLKDLSCCGEECVC